MMHLIECTLSELFTAVNPSQGLCWECRQGVPQLLRRLKLSHGQVKVESTPRRLAGDRRESAGKAGGRRRESERAACKGALE